MRARNAKMKRKANGSKEEHDKLVASTLIHLGANAFKIGRFFDNPTGVAYRDHVWGREYIRYGVKGSADIYGYILGGFIIYLEAKTGGAVQQENQVDFEKIARSFGCLYFVFHSKEEALEYVLRAASR